jgi:hypothetical protein
MLACIFMHKDNNTKKNSVAFSPQANYTDQSALDGRWS